jgi:uncharacterized membrane protein
MFLFSANCQHRCRVFFPKKATKTNVSVCAVNAVDTFPLALATAHYFFDIRLLNARSSTRVTLGGESGATRCAVLCAISKAIWRGSSHS